MADVILTIEGLDKLSAQFAQFPLKSKKYIQEALDVSGRVLLRHSQLATLASLPQKTGNMRGAFKWAISGTSGALYVDPSIAPYAIFVHEGTRAHDIYPKNAKVLAFQWVKGSHYSRPDNGGRWKYNAKQDLGMMFLKHVRHPGTKARPFMPIIAAQSTPEIIKAFEAAVNRMIASPT